MLTSALGLTQEHVGLMQRGCCFSRKGKGPSLQYTVMDQDFLPRLWLLFKEKYIFKSFGKPRAIKKKPDMDYNFPYSIKKKSFCVFIGDLLSVLSKDSKCSFTPSWLC